jgi:hypothetical protein
MDTTYNFNLGFNQREESKTETLNRLINQKAVQMISTGISLVTLFLGFSLFGILIIVNQHQAELNGPCGGSSVVIFGGIVAILLGTAFLVAAGLHWRSWVAPRWLGRRGAKARGDRNFA